MMTLPEPNFTEAFVVSGSRKADTALSGQDVRHREGELELRRVGE